jgi:hypothetical protein
VLNSARKAGSIATNVCDTVKLDAKTRPRTREKDLRQDEVYAILKASLPPDCPATRSGPRRTAASP